MTSKFLNLSTDTTLGGASPSDNTAVSQSAIKAYADTKVGDVTISGTSIVSSGTAVIPIAQQSGDYGLVKFGSDSGGLLIASNGTLQTRRATDSDIAAKTQLNRPIVPGNLDLAVKTSVTTNTITLTSAEQDNACTWLGASRTAILRVWSE